MEKVDTDLDNDFARSWLGDGDIPDLSVALARYDDGLHVGYLSVTFANGTEEKEFPTRLAPSPNSRSRISDFSLVMTSSMSEHSMPAPIASTATTAAPPCTDCLPAPSTPTSTSASTSAAPPPDVAHQQAALLDPSTFEPPALGSSNGEAPRVVIEFCDRCRYAQAGRPPSLLVVSRHLTDQDSLVTGAPRWLHRATWTQTELFLTFPPSVDAPPANSPNAAPVAPGLRSISLVPRNAPETGGRFRVWLLLGDSAADVQGPYPTGSKGKERWRGWELVWDRKIEGRFPEMKELVSAHLIINKCDGQN